MLKLPITFSKQQTSITSLLEEKLNTELQKLNKILKREKRIDLYKDCLKFLKTRVELDLALFKDDIWSH